jgi:hypothetical protein
MLADASEADAFDGEASSREAGTQADRPAPYAGTKAGHIRHTPVEDSMTAPTPRERAIALLQLAKPASLETLLEVERLLVVDVDEEGLRQLREARATAEAHVQLAAAVALKCCPGAA